MLNLVCVFDDAVEAIRDHSSRLAIAALPATVFLLQRDVINHYRYAVEHYLDVDLGAPFLQGSSFGSPYQKWAHFTNEDFEQVSFVTANLVRYTSRLVHETTLEALEEARQFAARSALSNGYTVPLCKLKYEGAKIGVRVGDDQTLTVSPFVNAPHVRPFTVSIRDRGELRTVKGQGLAEIAALERRSSDFAAACRRFHDSEDPFRPFTKLHESWCV